MLKADVTAGKLKLKLPASVMDEVAEALVVGLQL
jgi:hypothetical protein